MISTATANLIMTFEPAILMAIVAICHIVAQVNDTQETMGHLNRRHDDVA